MQKPSVVARKMVKGIEKGKKSVSPCALFGFAKALMKFLPFVRTMYWGLEKRKFEDFKQKSRAISKESVTK